MLCSLVEVYKLYLTDWHSGDDVDSYLGGVLVRLSAGTQAILTEVFCGTLQSLQQMPGEYFDYATIASL
jgi:hypothetical protein